MVGRFKKEGTYVYLWLIHAVVQQKPTKHCKAIIPLKIFKKKKKKEEGMKKLFLLFKEVIEHVLYGVVFGWCWSYSGDKSGYLTS